MGAPARRGSAAWWLILAALQALGTLSAAPAVAQREQPVPLPRLSGPIRLDGISDEPAWQAIEPLPLVMLEPTFGAEPSERTEIRVGYDDQYIYASLRGYDSDPSGVRANSLYRDRSTGDDIFVVFLDTFNDNENGVSFTINPLGSRRDAAISNDAAGLGGLNADFNTFWDSKTVINGEGWFAETRIPFSSLRFQDENGRVVMGLITFRMIARRNERDTFPALSPSTERAYIKPSLAQKVVLEGVYARKPLHLTPYVLGGLDRKFDDAGRLRERGDDSSRELGMDMKYGLTTNLTLDLTVNTDFAQVEADDQQVNLTRFSLFFPEKREFFQERAGIFEFDSGRDTRLFHSRRIGLTDRGEVVRILGGARVIGRIGSWDVGMLDMQTADHASLPSENFGVLRLRRQVLNPYSYAGGMVTSRIGTDGRYNAAYGLDGVLRLAGDDYLSVLWAQTADRDSAATDPSFGIRTGQFSAELERRRRNGLGFRSMLSWSGRGYDPGMGFSRRTDYTLNDHNVLYTWLAGPRSPFIWHTAAMEAEIYTRNRDGSVESAEIGPEWSFGGKSGNSARVEAKLIREDLLESFDLSERAVVPAGRYTFPALAASYRGSSSNLFRIDPEFTIGRFYDGWQTSIALSPTWIASRHVEIGGTYLHDVVRFPDREQSYDGQLFRLRVGTALNTQLSANSFIQFNSRSNAASANVRLRYNFREGNDLWIVFNEGLDTERYRVLSSLPLTQSRALMIKYTHTFQL